MIIMIIIIVIIIMIIYIYIYIYICIYVCTYISIYTYRSKSHTLSHVDNPGFHACAILRPLHKRPYWIKRSTHVLHVDCLRCP